MKRVLFRYSILFVILVGLCSWGEKAHRKINSSCVEFFPSDLQPLKVWAPILADHSSDADFRKKKDKTEFVKHFIDIDNYDDFKTKHRIIENFDQAYLKYGREKIYKEGTLPWTTDSTYRELVQNFKKGNWDRAVLTAADLGHYVGDGFMPLHVTANYNGQLSNQTGIHSRYEETMIDRNIENIHFQPAKCKKVTKVQSYIFKYLYSNNSYIVPLLEADASAFATSGHSFNDLYYQLLWTKTGVFTNHLLEESSKTLATLIYSAWCDAGKPKIPATLIQTKK